ncbi:MAG: tRNA pseudouridine(38-40) synthase TruA [Clostridia bacterium]|nr:tRNA pseudouridine(38-40) synthase TruA [Clostridia bacterium]
MRRNYKMHIMYDGTDFGGWQRQKNAVTIQGEIEKALGIITKNEISLIGASRTDAGVHAYDYVANVFLDTDKDNYSIWMGLNALLPEGIRVKSIEPCADEFHARYDAKHKTYVYNIDNSGYCDVFTNRYMWKYRYPLDYEKMKEAAGHFVGVHDFSAFMSQGGTAKTFTREIYSNDFEILGDKLKMTITGNGFLYNMVRIIAGTLVSVGRGDINPSDIPDIIESKERKRAGITAPPEGLILYKITY